MGVAITDGWPNMPIKCVGCLVGGVESDWLKLPLSEFKAATFYETRPIIHMITDSTPPFSILNHPKARAILCFNKMQFKKTKLSPTSAFKINLNFLWGASARVFSRFCLDCRNVLRCRYDNGLVMAMFCARDSVNKKKKIPFLCRFTCIR